MAGGPVFLRHPVYIYIYIYTTLRGATCTAKTGVRGFLRTSTRPYLMSLVADANRPTQCCD